MPRTDSEISIRQEVSCAKAMWGPISPAARNLLVKILSAHQLSVLSGDISLIAGRWYVTHPGLLRVARRNRCFGIDVRPVRPFCDATGHRWAFKATVYKSKSCRGFVGFGDADPTNVSQLLQGAEMRIAETRAVNRALRKAYGIGICSTEELGSNSYFSQGAVSNVRQLSMDLSNRSNGESPTTGRIRDRLCQIIRQHKLDAELVKSYAVDFCGANTLREASRDQIENFVAHLADWAAKDRNALLCQLNSYQRKPQAGVVAQEGAA